ncbi:MAG: ABC transporter permease [Bdellovibrionales bacterium]|nr:ABC transporter permease [Bdellovibrionales bacterium]
MTSISRPFGVDIFCLNKKFLILNLVSRNLKLKYRRSILGVLWTLIVPASSALTYYLVFQFVMKVPIPNYLLFVVCGILPWNFLAQSITQGMESIVSNYPLLSKVPIPSQVFTYTETITAFINLILSTPVILVVALFTDAPIGWQTLLYFPLMCLLFIQAYSLSYIFAVLFVFFRDLRHLTGIIVQIWFYATPILYSQSLIPEGYQSLLYLNPCAFIFTVSHKIWVTGAPITGAEVTYSVLWTAFIFAAATLLCKYNSHNLVERI